MGNLTHISLTAVFIIPLTTALWAKYGKTLAVKSGAFLATTFLAQKNNVWAYRADKVSNFWLGPILLDDFLLFAAISFLISSFVIIAAELEKSSPNPDAPPVAKKSPTPLE